MIAIPEGNSKITWRWLARRMPEVWIGAGAKIYGYAIDHVNNVRDITARFIEDSHKSLMRR